MKEYNNTCAKLKQDIRMKPSEAQNAKSLCPAYRHKALQTKAINIVPRWRKSFQDRQYAVCTEKMAT